MSTEYLSNLVAPLTPNPSDDGESMKTEQMDDIELNMFDVYEHARRIRAEFEKITEVYGDHIVHDLVQRVNHLIQLLENQVIRNEKCVDDLLTMKKSLNTMQFERYEIRELKKKHRDELESIDNQWQVETDLLIKQITTLEKENHRLKQNLERHPSTPTDSTETVALTRDDLQKIKSQSEQNSKLTALLKSKDQKLKQTLTALESMREQVDALSKTNATLKRQQTLTTNQVKRLAQEKLELEVQLKEKENMILQIKERTNEKDNDSSTSPTIPVKELPADFDILDPNQTHFSIDLVRQIIWEKIDIKETLMRTEDKLCALEERLAELTAPPTPSPLPSPNKDLTKQNSFWIIFSLFPIIISLAIVRFCWNVLRRAKKTTSLPTARRGSLSDIEQSSLSSPIVQSGVLMAKSSLPLRSPRASFAET